MRHIELLDPKWRPSVSLFSLLSFSSRAAGVFNRESAFLRYNFRHGKEFAVSCVTPTGPPDPEKRRARQYAEYTSASLNTWGKFAWRLSEVRIVARHPQPGYFPAIWTTGRGSYKGCIHANSAWSTTEKYRPRWHSFSKPLTDFLAKDPDWVKKFHI